MGLIGCVGLPEAPWLISILRTSLMLVDFDRDPKHRLWSFSHWRLIIRLRLVWKRPVLEPTCPWKFLVGVCRPVLQILTLFQTKKCHFSHPFSDLASKHLCPFSDLVSLLRLERPQWYWAYWSATVLPVRRHLRFGIIYYVFPFWCFSFRVGNQQWSAVFLDAWLRQQQQVRRTGNTPWAVSSPSLTRRRYYLGP